MTSTRRRLILHIGLPKTGSSALQAFFATKEEALLSHDIRFAKSPRKGDEYAVTSGNGYELHQFLKRDLRGATFDPDEFLRTFEATYFDGRSTALVSGEGLWQVEAPLLDQFLAHVAGFADVTVVMFIRDIYGDAYATWMQHVKIQAMRQPFEEYAREFVPRFGALSTWGERFPDLRVVHYNSSRSDLLRAFCTAASLPNSIVNLGPLRNVNRSLDFEELTTLMQLTRMHGGRLSRQLTNALLRADPNKKTDVPLFPAIADSMTRRFAQRVGEINAKYFASPLLRVVDETTVPCDSTASTALSETQLLIYATLIDLALKGNGAKVGAPAERIQTTLSDADVAAHLVTRANGMLRKGSLGPAQLLARAAARMDPSSSKAVQLVETCRVAIEVAHPTKVTAK